MATEVIVETDLLGLLSATYAHYCDTFNLPAESCDELMMMIDMDHPEWSHHLPWLQAFYDIWLISESTDA